jgi:hypothetical protein
MQFNVESGSVTTVKIVWGLSLPTLIGLVLVGVPMIAWILWIYMHLPNE